jgi:hypothetical protein
MTKTTIRTRVLVAILGTALVAGLLSVVAPVEPPAADAADLSSFDPGMIITDEIFYDSSTMSAGAIQSFMEAKDPDCANYTLPDGTPMMCIQTYKAKITARDANSNCAAIDADSSESASSILYIMAKACGVNPQVLLVLLQKEEDLILNAHSEGRYRIAAGYGCPDTAACNTKYYGYANQLYNAAYSFKQWSRPIVRQYMPGKTNTIRYSPNAKCGSASVYIKNYATAALYMYTPYVPNKAALAAGYGYGDSCSAYGNRNFFNYFADWFGNPGNLLKNSSFSSKTTSWTSGTTGSITATSGKDASKAQSGTYYLTLSSSTAGRRLQQDVSKRSYAGYVYTAGVWVRADEDGQSVDGSLLLSTRGGTTETATLPFTATDTWTYVPINLAVAKSGHTGLRFGIQLTSTSSSLRIDTTSLYLDSKQVPRASLALEEYKVKSGTNGGWKTSSSTKVKLSRVRGPAISGTYNAQLTVTSSGQYIAQYISRSAKAGTSYTFGAWMRSGTPGVPYTGRLRITGRGGTTEEQFTSFTVGDEWTYKSVTIDLTKSKHNVIGVYFYPDSVGTKLYYDKLSLTSNLINPSSSFETDSSDLYGVAEGTTAVVVPADETVGDAVDGASFLRMTRTSVDDSYIQQEETRKLGVGEKYTYSIWVRSAVPGTTFDGRIVLEGRTSDAGVESVEQAFTATDEWTLVSVEYTTASAALTRIRSSVLLDSDAADVYLDAAKLN